MVRKIVIVLLFLAGLLFILGGIFILGGVIILTVSPIDEAIDLPVWHLLPVIFFSLGCILLGILSLKRSRCFRSTWLAFLLLPARICTFILASGLFLVSISFIEESMANSTSEIHIEDGIIFAVIAFIFLGVTILLTLANKDKSVKTTSLAPASKAKFVKTTSLALANKYTSAKTTSLTPAGKYTSAKTTSLTPADIYTSAGTEYLTPPGKYIVAGIDYLFQSGKAKSAKRLRNQQDGRYVINPRNFGRDLAFMGALAGFWLILIPLTAGLTYIVYDNPHPVLYLALAIAYLTIIFVAVSLFTMNKEQVLEVKGNSLVVNRTTIIPPYKVRIDKPNLQALTLVRHSRDPVYILNLIQKGALRPKRILLASYVPFYHRAILFEEIKEFLQKNGFKFETRNEMANSVTTEWMLPQKGRSAKRRVAI